MLMTDSFRALGSDRDREHVVEAIFRMSENGFFNGILNQLASDERYVIEAFTGQSMDSASTLNALIQIKTQRRFIEELRELYAATQAIGE